MAHGTRSGSHQAGTLQSPPPWLFWRFGHSDHELGWCRPEGTRGGQWLSKDPGRVEGRCTMSRDPLGGSMGGAWESWGLLRALGHLQKTPLHTLTVAHLLRGTTHAPWRCLSPWDVTGCLQGCWPPWLDGCRATAVPWRQASNLCPGLPRQAYGIEGRDYSHPLGTWCPTAGSRGVAGRAELGLISTAAALLQQLSSSTAAAPKAHGPSLRAEGSSSPARGRLGPARPPSCALVLGWGSLQGWE